MNDDDGVVRSCDAERRAAQGAVIFQPPNLQRGGAANLKRSGSARHVRN